MRPSALGLFVVGLTALWAVSCSDGSSAIDQGAERSAAEKDADTIPPTTTSAPTTSVPTTTVPTTTVAAEPTTTTSTTEAARSRSERQASGGTTEGAAARLNADGTPVFNGDFADPFVLEVDGDFYGFATNTAFTNVPVMVATGTGDGGYLGEALPDLPPWSKPGHVWAPSVTAFGDGYILYYTTRHSSSGRQCVSVAVATSPAGPYFDSTDEPLVCDLAQGGSIDASPFVDSNGDRWLLWKSDGNCCGLPTVIYTQPLSADGLSIAGDPIELIRNDLSWERDVVEAPSMIENGGVYHLFYSGNRWDTPQYAVGHATCGSVTGPCVKDADPWLESYAGASGPGGAEAAVLSDRPVDLVVYHGWTDGDIGYESGRRSLYVTPIRWVDGEPTIAIDG